MRVLIKPTKPVVSVWFCYLISFIVLGCVISGIYFIINLSPFVIIPVLVYVLIELIGTRFAWYKNQELKIADKKLQVIVISVVDSLGGGKTTYSIGKILSIKEGKSKITLKVSDSTVREHPFKPKECKKVIIYDCNDEARELINKFMEG